MVPKKGALQGWSFRLSFPRVRARIPSNFDFLLSQPSPVAPISYDFGAFSCPSLLSLFGLSFSTFGVLQRHFIAPLLNFVRKNNLVHCVSIYYRVFCEGCESKKYKTHVMRVRACAREAPNTYFSQTKTFHHSSAISSLSNPSTKGSRKGPTKKKLSRTFLQKRGRFSKKRRRFFQKRGRFSKISTSLSLPHPTYSPKRVHLSPSPQGTTAVAGNGSPSKLSLFRFRITTFAL